MQRPRTPTTADKARPRAPAGSQPPRPAPRPERKPGLVPAPGKPAEAGAAGAAAGGAESATESSPRSAVGKAFHAFMANGPAESLPATIDAAVAAAAIAVGHVRKRAREKLLLGKPGGKRISGPMQITLEDLLVG